MTDETHPFDGQFEPPAEAIAKMNPGIPLPAIAQASIAISLKRIADALNGDGLDFSNIAHEAGMAFQNGINRQR